MSSLVEGKEVSTNRRKRKRVLDSSQASMPTGADSTLSTNQIPVMVSRHITDEWFSNYTSFILYFVIQGFFSPVYFYNVTIFEQDIQ